MRVIAALLLVALVALGALYFIAGRTAPPALTIDKPERVIGQTGTLEVTAAAPRDRLTTFTVTLEQNGRSTPLFSLDSAQAATVTEVDPNRVRVSRPFGATSPHHRQAGTVHRPGRNG